MFPGRWVKIEITDGGIMLWSDMLALIAALLLSWAGSAAAQAPAATCVIEGRVINAVTKEPLAKARVTLMVLDSRERDIYVTTDASGQFRFEGVERGTRTLRAERNGYIGADSKSGDMSASTERVPCEGKALPMIELALVPQAVLAGHVVDADGEPVPNVGVTATRKKKFGPLKVFGGSHGVSTNADGYFLIANLEAGEYVVDASPPWRRGRPAGGAPAEDYVRTYYPNVPGESEAAVLKLEAGTEMRDIRIAMSKGRLYTVRGKAVHAESGIPVERARLFLMPSRRTINERRGGAYADVVKGEFVFSGVREGSYIAVSHQGGLIRDEKTGGYVPSSLTCYVPVEAGGDDVEGLVVEMGRGFTVEGLFRGPDLAPGGNGGQTAPSEVRAGLTLKPLQGIGTYANAKEEEDGTFKLSNVAPDRYRIDITPPGGMYVKEIRSGGRALGDWVLDLTSGANAAFEIDLARNAAEVRVNVRDKEGVPAGRAVVMLWRGEREFRTGASDENGDAVMRGLGPGEYLALAWRDIDGPPPESAEERAMLKDLAARVVVEEGARRAVEVKPIEE